MFFQKGKLLDMRVAVLIDECDAQSYGPLLDTAQDERGPVWQAGR